MRFEGIDVPPGTDVESISLSPADRLLASCFRTRFAGGQPLGLTITDCCSLRTGAPTKILGGARAAAVVDKIPDPAGPEAPKGCR